jgi:hypothetical protein
MAHTLRYLEDDHIIFTEYGNPIDRDELLGVVQESLQLSAEKECLLFLGDCRTLPSSGSAIDVYELGDLMDRLRVDRRTREALVVTLASSTESAYDFFVALTTNRGIQVRLFGTMDAAKAWLLSEGDRLGIRPGVENRQDRRDS